MKKYLRLPLLLAALFSLSSHSQESINYVNGKRRLNRLANGSFVEREGRVYFRTNRHIYEKIGRCPSLLRIRNLVAPSQEVALLYEDEPVVLGDSDSVLIPVRAANPGHVVLKERGRPLLIGETLWIAGYNPHNKKWTKVPAMVIQQAEKMGIEINYWNSRNVVLRYSGQPMKGMSGSPVLDRMGNLVGLYQGHFNANYLLILANDRQAPLLEEARIPEIFPSKVYDSTNPFNSFGQLI